MVGNPAFGNPPFRANATQVGQWSTKSTVVVASVGGGLILLVGLIFLWLCSYNLHRKKAQVRAKKADEAEILRTLESVSTKQTLKQWLPTVREELQVSERIDTRIICCGISSICLDLINPDDTIHALKCYHVFHDFCLEKWVLASHSTCPLCQQQFYLSLEVVRTEQLGNSYGHDRHIV
ncbi:RING finger protein [Aspergillus lucknowensis]|uniref:RING-type domain-containing protein n=1 Tax=Aspergillus lucknowensis TaxID=176173 RepID=A0ABR4LWV0_9EURO